MIRNEINICYTSFPKFDIRVSVHRLCDFIITTNKVQLFLIIYF